jgi:hypothetical protein
MAGVYPRNRVLRDRLEERDVHYFSPSFDPGTYSSL